jgi:nucleotide-binding universal stress UspA family protein
LPQEIPATECQAASAYLTTKKQAPEFEGIPIQTRLLVGMPAQQILSCLETRAIDLVVMCSCGETGLKRWAWGSVAQKVLRHSHVPVLILHESAGLLSNQHPAGRRPVRVLVALDGSSLAEKALKPATELSHVLSEPEKGMLHLVHVIRIPERAHQAEERSAAFQLDLAVAQTRLQLTAESFLENAHNSAGCLIQASVVGERDIASGIIRAAEGGIPATAETEARARAT